VEGGDFGIMAGIDERIVNMTMRSATFISAASSVINAIEKLKSSLNGLKGSEKALSGLESAGKRVDLSGIGKGIEDVASKFGFLRVAAEAAFATIVTKAVMAAGQLLKSFTVDPIVAGLHEYENELNTTAVIMANTGLSGEKGMQQIRTALGELNTYADKTIYSFEDMTSAIGKFTAAGVSLEDSVVAIKGLANLAALSGSTAQQAAVAQYQLSQAIATGTIRLMDWNSVVNAGMGGKVFQNSLIETARVHGVEVDAMIKKNGSFRDSLQEGWLTSKILLETLSKFTGDLGAKQLKQMGYTDKQIAQIQKQAQAAVDAATKVRTLTQMISTVGEAVQSAWAGVWRAVFGNMEQATQLWTSVGNTLSKIFVAPINNLQKLASEWAKLGGRAVLIDTISDAFKILGSVLKPIGQAFRDVFPATTAQRLVDLTKGLHDFVNGLKLSASASESLHRIFEGLFSGIKIVWDVIKGVVGVIGQMLSAATGLGGGLLSLAARFGTFLSNLRKSIESGDAFTNFFRNIGTVLSAPVKVLGVLVHILDALAAGAGKALAAMQPFLTKVVGWFSQLGDVIANAIRSGDLSKIMTVLNQGLFAGILLAVRKFIKNFGSSLKGGGGFLDKIKGMFSGLTDALKSLQMNLNAGTLQKIAIAIGILTVSLVGLSMIDAGKLSRSLTAITVMFTQLLAAMAVVAKISPVGITQMFAVSVALNVIASAILVLSASVAVLSRFSWAELVKGISAIAVMLGILVAAVNLLSKNVPGVVAAAVAMNLMATALNLLAIAVRALGSTDWATLAKGVVTIAAILTVVGTFNKFGGKGLVSTAASMLILGAALNVIALAIKQLAALSVSELAKGLVGIAAGLVLIAVGMTMMPKTMLATATGLLVVSGALVILSKALSIMGGMSWTGIAKSMIVLAGSLVILSAAMMLMTGALAGAAALLVVSAALAVLTPVLMALGSMSWSTLLTSLAALAGVFLLLGAAGVLLAPLAPIILALGAAIALMGVGVLALGGGIALLGAGLVAIGMALQTSGAAIVSFVTSILNLIPLALARIGQGIVAFAGAIAKGGAAITAAFTTILTAILNSIIKVMPLIGKAISQILQVILNLIIQYSPRAAQAMVTLVMALLSAIASRIGQFVQKGADIIVGFIRGIAANLGRVVRAGVDAVVAFINGVSANIGRVIDAGVKLVIAFVNGVANSIRNNAGAMRAAAWNLGTAIIDGITGGLWSKAGSAISAAESIASSILGALGKVLHILSPSKATYRLAQLTVMGLVLGLEDTRSYAVDAARETAEAVLQTLENTLVSKPPSVHPVITPVIDLSAVDRGYDDYMARARGSKRPRGGEPIKLPPPPPEGTFPGGLNAGGIAWSPGTYLTFTQYNTSPKALSTAEIYRQTRNQLSIVRGGLPK
jgi:tape measure domain-containing protein